MVAIICKRKRQLLVFMQKPLREVELG